MKDFYTHIVLDSGPLGLVTNPRETPESLACFQWLEDKLEQCITVAIPEIVHYELRRELIRGGKKRGLRRLESFVSGLYFLELNSSMLNHAAELWAKARNEGHVTASMDALDIDVILASQALWLDDGLGRVVIATDNISHLSYFIDSQQWEDI